MSDDKPCCAAEADRRVRMVDIGGTKIGIPQLDHVIEEISKMKLDNEKKVKEELLKQIKIFNYVPPSAEDEYVNAVYKEYNSSIIKNEGV